MTFQLAGNAPEIYGEGHGASLGFGRWADALIELLALQTG